MCVFLAVSVCQYLHICLCVGISVKFSRYVRALTAARALTSTV